MWCFLWSLLMKVGFRVGGEHHILELVIPVGPGQRAQLATDTSCTTGSKLAVCR